MSELCPEIGARFDSLFERLLGKTAEERFASTSAVRQAAARLDWTEPPRRAAAQGRGPAQAPGPVIQGESDTLYEVIGEPFTHREWGAAQRSRHSALEMNVLRLEVDSQDRFDEWGRLGALVSPYLQLVLDREEEALVVTVEEPGGEPLLGGGQRPSTDELLLAVRQVALALAVLHEADLSHGAVDNEHVRRQVYRSVLLLPPRPGPADQRGGDIRSLEALTAAAFGAPPTPSGLAGLVTVPPFASGLGPLRGPRLAARLGPARDATELVAQIDSIREAMEAHSRDRQHLHALTAAARAHGADPGAGALAEFLGRRAGELGLTVSKTR